MIRIYPAHARHSGDLGWLQYNFSFSFADYQDPDNVSFGPLRVFNDDFIQPQKGFGTHPHRDMEIVTIVLAGQIQHEDNTGGKAVIRPGEVQRMTAGTGILHSEMNPSASEVANTLQIWFLPREKGLEPSYEQKAFKPGDLKNRLHPVVSGQKSGDEVVHIHQDLTVYMSELESGTTLTFEQEAGRLVFVFVMEGAIRLGDGDRLGRRDSARISHMTQLRLTAEQNAHFLLIDLPQG